MEITAGNEVKNIILKKIEVIDRPLNHAVSSKIKNSSKHGSFLIIDYLKDSTIGTGEIVCSMVVAGKKMEISNFKYFLNSLLGLKVDPLLSSMKPEEIRLLVLLSTNVNKVDILLPIFNNDKDLLRKSFASLKSKNLVDDCASPTQKGQEILEKVKGIERKKIGMEVVDKFDELSRYWNRLDKFPDVAGMNKVVWKIDQSSLSGSVSTEDIYKYLPLHKITEVKLGLFDNNSMLGLFMESEDKASIFFRSSDFSVVLALHGLLNSKLKVSSRIIWSFFLGFGGKKEMLNCLDLKEDEFEHYKSWFLEHALLSQEDMELTDEGLKYIHQQLLSDSLNLLNMESSDISFDKFKRYEELKMNNAKKRVTVLLQSRHAKKKAQTENKAPI